MSTPNPAPTDPRLRVLARLGRGGMSDVWLAAMRGPAGFEKLVAVKQLRALDTVDRSSAFMHEARLAAMLNHTNIVQTFEVMAQGGDYRIVMEFLQGQPLNRILTRASGDGTGTPTAIPLRALVRVLVDVLAGLHFAHQLTDHTGRVLNVVHRDVSPHNIFVTWDGGVKLLDFGIAAFERAERTEEGLLKGKLTYMSPEQAKGETVDRRSDVFSVGIILWELLASRRMWAGLTDPQIYRELTHGRIPDIGPAAPLAPPELVQIAYWALAADPADRYPTAEQMRADLDRWLGSVGRPSPQAFGELIAAMFATERERIRAIVAAGLSDRHPDEGEQTDLYARTDSNLRPASFTSSSVHSRRTPPPGEPDGSLQQRSRVTPALTFGDPEPEPPPRRHRSWLAVLPLSGLLAAGAGAAAVGLGWIELSPEVANALGFGQPAPVPVPPTGLGPDGCPLGTRPLVELSGDIDQSYTLKCAEDYRLVGTVRVLEGASLTIEPGTVVRADPASRGTLVVSRGGRLIAEGRADAPIRFTSAAADPKPGDWGGILLLGRAPTNEGEVGRIEGLPAAELYGGQDPKDSSGTLRYVQIWYAGVALAPNNETNGLTLGAVGKGTTIDHVLVAMASDDCFEWFGGTVSASRLICFNPGDDAFDIDRGFSGALENLVAVDLVGGDGERNGFEVDNNANGTDVGPLSAPRVRAATLCGALKTAERPGYGLMIRRAAGGIYQDISVDGYAAALDLRDRVAPQIRGLAPAPGVPIGPDEPAGAEADDDHGVDEATRVEKAGTGSACAWPPVHGPGLTADDRWDQGWVPWDELKR